MQQTLKLEQVKKEVEERIKYYTKEKNGLGSGNSRSKYNLLIGELIFIREDLKKVKKVK